MRPIIPTSPKPSSRQNVRHRLIDRFAVLMRQKLDDNKGKGDHWNDATADELLERLAEDVDELKTLLRKVDDWNHREAIAAEAADVANFAAMIADTFGKLPKETREDRLLSELRGRAEMNDRSSVAHLERALDSSEHVTAANAGAARAGAYEQAVEAVERTCRFFKEPHDR
jgi:NTP pyrophosphatase (non-canonical NTP hydrolase)